MTIADLQQPPLRLSAETARDATDLYTALTACRDASIDRAADTLGGMESLVLVLGSSGAVGAVTRIICTWIRSRRTILRVSRQDDPQTIVEVDASMSEEAVRTLMSKLLSPEQ